jgi:SNF family Na+-dependent transporter
MTERERWATRIGLVLAMAGNAVGLGNFLRFPRQAALNGGGAFMVPYFVALLLMGIPLMWLEWAMGRYGGQFGETTTAGQFDRMWQSRWAKYVGSIGISIPLLFVIYYTYIESWCLGYAFFSLGRRYFGIADMNHMNTFLQQYQGVAPGGEYFGSIALAVLFWLVTVGINVWVIGKGISAGIEKLAKVAMPLLIVFGLVLLVRVFTLGTPDPAYPDRSVLAGLAFIWNPDYSRLGDFAIWLAAAGQIFFTLSIGNGTLSAYASYLRKDDDCALTGLSTSATNEFVEVILGGSIAIPVAVAFFGLATTQAIAAQGSFDLGFVAMPIIFQKLPLGFLFGAMWFLLLFFAGITSSVALCTPFMAFLKESFGLSRGRAALIVAAVMTAFGLPIVLFLKFGYMDQYDFWIGMLLLSLLALVESLIFIYAFRKPEDRGRGLGHRFRTAGRAGWEEITRGAEIRVPRVFYYILKFVVPVYLLVLFGGWLWQDLSSPSSYILMKGVSGRQLFYGWVARGTMLGVIAGVAVLVHVAWKRRPR